MNATVGGALGGSVADLLFTLKKAETSDIDARIAKFDVARENLMEAMAAIDEMKASAESKKQELTDLEKSVAEIGKQRDDLNADRELIARLTSSDKDRLRRVLGAPTRLQSIVTTIASFVFGAIVTWCLSYAYDFGVKDWMHGLWVRWTA